MTSRASAVAVALAVGLASAPAGAQLGANGTPIRTSNYKVDLTQGPVLAGTRVTGLAGAYVAIAEGVDGMLQTPVTPAVRPSYSVDNFDYDLGFGLMFPSAISNSDFFNTGRGATDLSQSDQTQFVFLTPAAYLQFGDWGVGISAELQRYGLERTDSADAGLAIEELEGSFGVVHLQLARAFFDHQLYLGVGTRAASLTINEVNNTRARERFFDTQGAGLEVGALWRPNGLPFRVGVAWRTAVTPDSDPVSSVAPEPGTGDLILPDPAQPNADCRTTPGADCLWLPREVTLPWDLHVGLAVQFGPRPLNPRWRDPDRILKKKRRFLGWRDTDREFRRLAIRRKLEKEGRAGSAAAAESELDKEETLDDLHLEREERDVRNRLKQRDRELPRHYLLISMSLLVQGPVDNGVGVESFLQRTVDRSGESVTFSPRLGLEGEPVADWVKLRLGTYGEPTRFNNQAGAARLHGTFGLDTKLFPWTVFGLFDEGTWWRAGGAVDVARRYFGWGVAVGVWH